MTSIVAPIPQTVELDVMHVPYTLSMKDEEGKPE
jgi:hypothetical protein